MNKFLTIFIFILIAVGVSGGSRSYTDTNDHTNADGSEHSYIDQDVTTEGTPEFARVNIDGTSIYIDSDGSGNMTFTDTVVGTITLEELGTLPHKYIKAAFQSEGDLHLSDATNWGVSKAMISIIRIVTSSTDWDLWLIQNDNGFAANDANIPRFQIMGDGEGSANIFVNIPYEDEDASNEVHIYYLDNSGANTADIYIIGYGLR